MSQNSHHGIAHADIKTEAGYQLCLTSSVVTETEMEGGNELYPLLGEVSVPH